MTPDDSSERSVSIRGTRRQYLAAVSAGSLGLLAGCSSDGGSADDGVPAGGDPAGRGTPSGTTPTGEPTAADESGPGTLTGSCPPTPVEYSRREVSAHEGGPGIVSTELPAGRTSTTSTSRGLTVTLGDASLGVLGHQGEDGNALDQFIQYQADREVTEQYDVAPDARVAAGKRRYGVPSMLAVLFPTEAGFVGVGTYFSGTASCVDAVTAVQDRAITAARAV